MANIKISNLPVALSVAGSDSFPVVQSGVTKQATKSVLLTDLGTPASLVLTNAAGLPIDAGTINTLPVARGGTGVTTSTGSGNVVLSASPTLTGTTIVSAFTASGNVSFDGGTFVFNESGANKDARFEGDGDPNLLFLDASSDRIGIGTNTPSYKLDILNNANGLGGSRIRNSDSGSSASAILQIGNDTNGAAAALILHSSTNTTALGGANALSLINGLAAPLVFATTSVERGRFTAAGDFVFSVNNTAPSLSANSTMSFELTSNTSLKIVVRGTDGTTRSVSLTLS